MQVCFNDIRLDYSGRIDRSNPEKPQFIYPASSLRFCFEGRRAVLKVENRRVCWDNYVGAIVDGVQKCWKLAAEGITEITLLEEAEDGLHDILFFKRQDGCHELVLQELELSEGAKLLDAPPKSGRRIEVYGDSVSAGEVAEAVDYVGKVDPAHNGEYSNSWYSYAWMAARKLGAELHNISQGGIPLLNGNGWVCPPVYPGMEYMWDKLHYMPCLSGDKTWNFKQYTPHVVILAIGQNDSNPQDYMRDEPDGLRAQYWKYKYQKLVEDIRAKYPKAMILLTTTILWHEENWDRAIEDVCRKMGDDRVRHFVYRRNGKGTPGHIRIPEAEEMAQELAEYINGLDIPVWENE